MLGGHDVPAAGRREPGQGTTTAGPTRGRKVPELVATGPGQVYSWDITKLAGPAKGIYNDAYVMIDIYSRYIVGAHVHARENGVLAEELMKEIFGIHGIPVVVHADRGTSMTSKSVATLLADLGVVQSHSRPNVSNDNPYSESLFKTMKYTPAFPERFGSLAEARVFMARFAEAYNHEHHRTGIGLHSPADVHYGHVHAVAATRSEAPPARAAHPERFTTNDDPKIIALPDHAWINRPAAEEAAHLTTAGIEHLEKFRRRDHVAGVPYTAVTRVEESDL